jgi:glycerol-3-phosphate dehydrogenase (NAD(P)+)
VSLVAPHAPLRNELLNYRENRKALPGVRIPDTVGIIESPDSAIGDADIVLFPGPCEHMREMARSVAAADWSCKVAVTAAKGIEPGTLMRMTELLANELPNVSADRIVAISGPSFARFVGLGQPTTVVAAARSDEAAYLVQDAFMNREFRVYCSPDAIGVELGGALKNVIALAAGMADGLGLGDNTRAALMTRGLAEITRLGLAMGAHLPTFMGLSGMGDLVLTCSGKESRNHFVGEQLGKGRRLSDVLSEMVTVAEGIKTAPAAIALAARWNVQMPISSEVHAVLFEERKPQDAVVSLMMRDPKPEHWN